MKLLPHFFPYKSLSAYVVILTFFTVFFTNISHKRWTFREVIEWDVTSYYGYLPATFIHKDISLGFTETDRKGYIKRMEFWPEKAENGGKVIKTTMGLAILYAPFFALAHGIAETQGYPATGFSAPYQVCIHLASLFYLAIALVYLRKLLLRLFSDTVTSLVIATVVIGTNLFYYATVDSAMPHCFNFSLITVFLYYTFQWHEKQTLWNTIVLGLLGGMIVLVRPVNILIFIFPILLYVSSYKELLSKIQFFWTRKGYLLLISFLVLLVLTPQLLYWKYITGHFLFNSYVGERFFFDNPHILGGLFSYRKGWLLYTPVMLFAFLGLYSLFKIRKTMFWAVFLFVLVNCYVIFSWWTWWYGAGFGMRPMIDSYALLALPMGAFFQQCFDSKKIVLQYAVVLVTVLLIWFNTFQAQQYLGGRIHIDAMTKESYWIHFLKNGDMDPAFENSLRAPDYAKARRGEEGYEFTPF